MVLRLFASRLSGEGDVQTAPVRVGRLRQNGDPRLWRHERRQGHAAKPRLVRLQDRRAAGERCGGHENDQENGQAAASSLAPPRREAPLLGAIAADLHFAPPPAVVLAAIIEQPAAGVAAAFSDAVKIAFCEQPDRRERDRTRAPPRPAKRARSTASGTTRRPAQARPWRQIAREERTGWRAPLRAAWRDARAPRRYRGSPREARSPAPGDRRQDPRARPRASAASRPLRRAMPSRAAAIRRRSRPRGSGSDARESRGRIRCWRSRARDRRRSAGANQRARGRSGEITVICVFTSYGTLASVRKLTFQTRIRG